MQAPVTFAALKQVILRPLKIIAVQLALLLFLYQCSRLLFFLINQAAFAGLSAGAYLRIAMHALRYDVSAILALNALYIVLMLLPLPFNRIWEKAKQVLFLSVNILAFLFEISDWAYFPFNQKRATADVLDMVGRQSDFWNLLPGFLKDYWFAPLGIAVFVVLFMYLNRRILKYYPPQPQPLTWQRAGLQLIVLALCAGLALVGIRGGVQYIPIGIRNAVQAAPSRYVPLVLNTPFSIINSYATPGLEEVAYLPEAEVHQLIPSFVKHYEGNRFQKKNVVVIILESFSKEFTGENAHDESYTPFLDSLAAQSLICTQSYANGLRSAEAIPAILAGIPSLMQEPFTTSNYGANQITSLPNTLKTKGYHSAFFHGGTNGTMSFDVFTAAAGFDRYFGRKEFGNEKEYDGNWGIWDQPFLQFTAQKLNSMPQPFMASVFTLSSHPPYHLPPSYESSYKGSLPVHRTVGYTDEALRHFFETASQQPWYQNTLFVITADHTSPERQQGRYSTGMGLYAVPLYFFAPGDTSLSGRFEGICQHLDILPSVLDYLGYEPSFFAFGNSIFKATQPNGRFAINWNNGQYQWFDDQWLLQTTDMAPAQLLKVAQDSLISEHLPNDEPAKGNYYLLRLKAFVQGYRQALIHNQMYVRPAP